MSTDEKKIDRRDRFKNVADECLWSFHCTMATEKSLADELKPTNSVSKNGRRMRHSSADQHYLTNLIFWSFPPMIQKDKSFIGRHSGAYFHSSVADECLYVGGRFHSILSSRGTGPLPSSCWDSLLRGVCP